MNLKNRKHGWRTPQLIWTVLFCLFATQDLQAQPQKKAYAGVEKGQSQTAKQEMSAHTDDLRVLMQALYDKYPEELAKSTQVGSREMTEWVFDGKANWRFEAIRRKQQTEAIDLVSDPEYTGDHILALVVGLETMLFDAYGGKNEYDIPATRDEKRLGQLQCQLEGVQKILEANHKRLALLEEATSRQLIQQTIQSIIQRIRTQDSTREAC